MFHSGSRCAGVGGAFVSWASDESAFVHNPAGLIQIEDRWTFTYEIRAGVRIRRIPDPNIKANFNYISFSALTYGSFNDYRVGIYTSPVFKGNTLEMRIVGVGGAVRVSRVASLGATSGLLVAYDSGALALGFWGNIGAFFQMIDNLSMGISFWLPSKLAWSGYANASRVDETTPAVLNAGFGFSISPTFLWFSSVEYIFWNGVEYRADDVSSPPRIDELIGAKLHFHTGITFLEKRTGAHLRFGLSTRGFYYPSGADKEVVLSAGIGAVAGKFFVEGAVEDTFLLYALGLCEENTGWENLSVSLKFPF